MIDKTNALQSLRPGAEWVLRGDDLEWLDQNQTQPTETEIQVEITRLKADYIAKEYQRNRKAAYTSEADPLFFKWQAGEATQAEWQAKRSEIKARFPKE